MAAIDDPYFNPPTKLADDKRPEPDRPGRPGPIARALIAAFFVLLGLVVLFIGFVVYLMIRFDIETATRSQDLAAQDSINAVANILVVGELLGPIPEPDPDYVPRRKALAGRIRSGRGFTESGGMNGDGTDWYEADLGPDLAAEVRAGLERSPHFKPAAYLPFPTKSDPAWWPKAWPEGSTSREFRLMEFVLPPTGSRLWIRVHRT